MGLVNNDAMLDYIHETKSAALHIFNDRKRITEGFVKAFCAKDYRRLLLVASGTSYNSCLTSKHFAEAVLQIPVSLSTSYDYAHYNTLFNADDFAITVTQEGESTNTIDALKTMKSHGIANCVITEVMPNTCTATADFRVDLDCGREFFGPKTKGYVCSVLTIYMCVLEAALKLGRISESQYQTYCDDCQATLDHLDSVVESADQWIELNKEDLFACERAYVIGNGPNVGTALEGALKSLETVRYFYFSFEAEEFLHGPLASVKTDVRTFIIAPHDQTYERLKTLYEAMKEQNEHVFIVGNIDQTDNHICNASFLDKPYMNVFEYIVPFQLLAYRTFKGKGIDLNVREYPRIGNAVATKAKELER